MLYSQTDKDPLESFLTRLVNDAVEEAATSVVKETVREMAREYIEYKQVDEVLDDLMADYLDEIGYELVGYIIILVNTWCKQTSKRLPLETDYTKSLTGDFGPVVQSVVSLTSLLRVISLTVLVDSIHNILIFFAEKNVSSFCTAKATHILSAKNFSIFDYHTM